MPDHAMGASKACPEILARIEELGFAEDPEFAAEILGDFLRDAQASLNELEDAIHAADIPRCERMAHRLKGASHNLGAAHFAALALVIERMAREGDVSRAAAVHTTMVAEFERVRSYLNELVRELTAR